MTRHENGDVLYAVYGTLRKGWGNHRLLDNDRTEFLGEIRTAPMFTLYGKGRGVPYVAENGTTAVTVEVYRTRDERVIRNVNGLEGYSGVRGDNNGWGYDTCDIETEWGLANMFVINREGNPASVIETGDFKKQG